MQDEKTSLFYSIYRFSTVLLYYGISLNPSAIGGDFYTVFLLSSLSEVPANVIVIATLHLLG